MRYPINDEGVQLLKVSEDFIDHAYPDPVSPLGKALQKAGLWRKVVYKSEPIPDKYKHLSGAPLTIGWGFTEGVHEGDRMTRAEGDAKLARLLESYVAAVRNACKIEPNENQLAGLTVCAWNIGKKAIASSSMVKAHNRGDFTAAARAFSLWNKAGGAVVPALEVRRKAEAALYLKPVYREADLPEDDEVEPMPQTVQPETSLLRSPIIQGTAVTATTGVTALANIADQVTTATTAWSALEPLMRWWPYIAIAAVIVVAGVVVYQRVSQRRGGWA